MFYSRRNQFVKLFAALPIVFILGMGVGCGVAETISGTSDGSGEIFYSFPVTGDEGTSDDGSDEDSYEETGTGSYYDDPASDSATYDETGATAGTNNNSSADEDPESIPVTIAKCEREEDEEDDDESPQALVKSLQSGKRAETFLAKGQKEGPSGLITLKSSRGTYYNIWEDEELTVVAVNLNTGAMATTSLKKDGSFDSLPLEITDGSNSIWISATDGEIFVNPVVIYVNDTLSDEESFEQCTIPDDETSFQLSKVLF